MKIIRVLLLSVMIIAASSIAWLGFSGGNENLFRLVISITVFASLCFFYIEETKKKQRRVTLVFIGLSLFSVVAGIVQLMNS